MDEAVNLAAKIATFSDYRGPRIVATHNDNDVRVRRVAGELFVLPAGWSIARRRGAARRGEVTMLLIEPEGTPNTGDPATATAAVRI